MATGRSSFAKRQRDMAKKARAQAKRDKRLGIADPNRMPDDDDDVVEEPTGPKYSNDELMEMVADLHRRYDDGQMSLDDFEDKRAELMAQITVD